MIFQCTCYFKLSCKCDVLQLIFCILGQSREPGTSYAVLYSLQRMVGRKCDFKTYADTEVILLFRVIDREVNQRFRTIIF